MRRQPVDVFGDHGLFAVGHTVLAQISLAEVRRHDLDVGAGVDPPRSARWRAAAQSRATAAGNSLSTGQATAGDARIANRSGAAANAWTLQVCAREALPRLLRRRLRGPIEIQETRLRAGVELHLQRVVVLPGNPDASR